MDLRYFINQCAEAGELKRVAAEVEWNLEISHVSKLTEEKKGPALLFEQPTGYDIPVASNLYGSLERMCLVLGVKTLDDLAADHAAVGPYGHLPAAPAGFVWTGSARSAKILPETAIQVGEIVSAAIDG